MPNKIRAHLKTLAACFLLITAATPALAEQLYELEFGANTGGEQVELQLPMGKSQIIRANDKLDQVVIGNPEVADIKLLSDRQVLILGIKPGHTNLVFKSKSRNRIALMDIVVGYDIAGIKRKFREVLPAERQLRAATSNDSVIISGQVSNTGAMEKAISIVNSYVPSDKVINLVQVGGGHQVMLEVKISEVSRNSLKALGINTRVTGNQGDPETGIFSSGSAVSSAFGTLDLFETGGGIADLLQVTITALEDKGLARTLAEPNLVAMSGQEASFLAGGEFPIPVAQSNDSLTGVGTITVEYKPFGVGLKFTPTVLSNNQINLELATEVSAIDNSNSFSISKDFTLPALTTRRMSTTIEMGDGQSFAIAGLMQNNLAEAISQFPFLGDLPVIGALFRSPSFSREETELVVIVTPKIVRPVKQGDVMLPTDNLLPPNQLEWFLLGKLEGDGSLERLVSKLDMRKPDTTKAAGYQGEFGHE